MMKKLLLCLLLFVPSYAYGISLSSDNTLHLKSVQSATITMGSSDISGTATISAVNTNNSIILNNSVYNDDNASLVVSQVLSRLYFISPTSVGSLRDANGSTTTIEFIIFEFYPGTFKSLQTGTITITANNVTGTDTISEVDINKSILFSYGLDSGGGTNARSFSAIDLTNSTTVTATRGNGTGAPLNRIGYAVLETY